MKFVYMLLFFICLTACGEDTDTEAASETSESADCRTEGCEEGFMCVLDANENYDCLPRPGA